MKRFYPIAFILSLALPSITNTLTAGRESAADLVREVQSSAPRYDHIVRLLASGLNPNIIVKGSPLVIYITMKIVSKKTADEAQWFKVLETLLQHKKINVDELDTNLYTALMYAAYYGHYDAVALLLRYNAYAGFCNERGESPISKTHERLNVALTKSETTRYENIKNLLINTIAQRMAEKTA